jgi:GH24 family phage-related lysozyme (muramidase)
MTVCTFNPAPGTDPLNKAAASFIQYWEGFEPVATWDVNAYRLGFGSDTEGPNQVRVVKGMTTTRERALANLEARIPQFVSIAQKQLGGLWDKLGLATRVAVVDMCYNYGALPASVLVAFVDNGQTVADAIRNHDNDNSGVNRDRRAAEAGLIIFDGGQIQ